jgi:hypothetical protein
MSSAGKLLTYHRQALVLNSTYDVIYNITTSLPLGADLHEFTIPTVAAPNAPAGSTALITSYLPLAANLSVVGGTGNDGVLEAYFEESVPSDHFRGTWF